MAHNPHRQSSARLVITDADTVAADGIRNDAVIDTITTNRGGIHRVAVHKIFKTVEPLVPLQATRNTPQPLLGGARGGGGELLPTLMPSPFP